MDLNVELRRNRDNLRVCGSGVIIFAFWSIIKSIINSMISGTGSVEDYNLNEYSEEIVFFSLILTLGAIFLIMAIRIYIGRTARKYANGKPVSIRFIVVTILVFAISLILNIAFYYVVFTNAELDSALAWGSVFGYGVIELTNISNLLEVAAAAIKVRRITKQLSAGQGS